MTTEEQVYRDLQIRIDENTVGFPATESGADIRLLKSLFSPIQAEMATLLTYRYESIDEIKPRSDKAGKSIEKVEQVLDDIARKGMIGIKETDGDKRYRLIPLIVGFGEAGAHKPTQEFSEAMSAYFAESTFWQEFVASPAPQMRTIPVEQSITSEHHVAGYDEIKHIIETTTDPIGVLPCVCREGAGRGGNPCKITSRKDTCMVFRDGAVNLIKNGGGREISKEEALEILRKNGEEGLVLQPSNTRGPDFICSCCGCCCGILGLHKSIPNPVDHWQTSYYASVDPDLCTACGTCVESCQVNAMSLDVENDVSVVDLTRCLGCGLCAKDCPVEAIQLVDKEGAAAPPNDTEELFEVIATQKEKRA